MIMTLSTFHGQAHPDITRGFNPVDHIFYPEFLGNHTTFIGGCMVSVKTGGNLLGFRSVG